MPAGPAEDRLAAAAVSSPSPALPAARPKSDFNRRIGIALCAVFAALALSAQLWLTTFFSFSEALLLAGADILPWLAALPGLIWLTRQFPLDEAHQLRHVAIHACACLVLSLTVPLVGFGVLHLAGIDPGPRRPGMNLPAPREEQGTGEVQAPESRSLPDNPEEDREGRRGPPGPPHFWRGAIMRGPMHWAVYALIVALIHGWKLADESSARRRRTAELERSLAAARLAALSNQLRPHFLFNSLNTIAWLVRQDPIKAETLILDLSDLLREMLNASAQTVVPLHEEVRLLDLYLDLQRVRFGERLVVDSQIEPEILDVLVPTLLLQPLAENALRHGVDRSYGRVTLTIEGARLAGHIRLAIRDDAKTAPTAPAAPGQGIGLNNTRARLQAQYGTDASLEARPLPDGGFVTECFIPLRFPSPP